MKNELSAVLILAAIIFLSLTVIQAQPCAYGSLMQAELARRPALGDVMSASNHHYVQKAYNCQSEYQGTYSIPTVFHVIHNGGPENISNEQILAALDQANAQLAGAYGGYNTRIRLELATINPMGHCLQEPAIIRIEPDPASSLTSDISSSDVANEIEVKNLSRWDPSRYLNIWVVRSFTPSTAEIAGMARFPEMATWETDGIVVRHSNLGNTGTASGNVINTLVHELGHYLGLYHVWGKDFLEAGDSPCYNCDSGGSIATGDMVCDTNPCCRELYSANNCSAPTDYCSEAYSCNVTVSYPIENFMSYVHSCQNRFTEGQALRMHYYLEEWRRRLWSADNLVCTGIKPYQANFSRESNVEWTTSNLPNAGKIAIRGDLIVPEGKTLIIHSGVEVNFCNTGSLIIKPNAKLVLYGKLTGAGCDMKTWQRVKVWGSTAAFSQFPINGVRTQGWIDCRSGSVIENAVTGISLYGPNMQFAGGQLSSDGATIKNCKTGIEFVPYQKFWPFPNSQQGQPRGYFGWMSNTTFITDNDYPHENAFHAFVHLTGVNGVSMTGCSFTNVKTFTGNDIVDRGYGIFANDAGFSVRSLCMDNSPTPWPGPCEEYVHSSFSGLGYGVYAARIGEGRPYTVRQANFEKCFVGIRNKGVTGGTILFNHFTLGELPSTAPTGDQAGIIFEDGTAGFTCEENHFIGGSGNATATIGTICINTGMANKTIRRNNFHNLTFGNLSNQQNASQLPQDGIRGLYYDCNKNFDVLAMDFSAPNGRIKAKQGLEIPDPINPGQVVYGAAGNRFSHTAIDFSNFGNPIEYFFNPFGQNEEPLAIEGNITLVPTSEANDCPVTYCEPPCRTQEEIALVKSDYFQHKDAYLAAKASHAANPTDESARQMAYRQRMMDEDAYMVVIHELYDTLIFNADTLRTWVANLGSLEGDLWLAGERLSSGNSQAALSLLSGAVGKYQLTGARQADIVNYQSILGLLDGRNIYDLDAATLQSVKGYLDADDYAKGWAKSILTVYGGHFPAEYVKYGDLIEERSTREEYSTPAGRLPEWIRVSPNPAGAHVDFSISLPGNTKEITLLIRDINGRQVLHQHGLAPTGTFVWHTNSLGSGLYFYNLIAEGRVLKSGKIVLSK